MIADAAYGPGQRQRLDAYAPAAWSGRRPIVVYFHGGSWRAGAKEEYRFVGAALAARGFAVVIPNYGLYPDARFPAFLDDGARAARWAKENAARYGGDPARLYLMGHSAGAYIAAMLALDGEWLAAVGMEPKRDVAGVIGLAGPYHFALDTDLLRGVFGAAPSEAATQPVSFVTPGVPPMLLVTGAEDETVRPMNAVELDARLRAAGAKAKLVIYPRLGHLGPLGAVAPSLSFLAPVLDDVTAFAQAASTPAATKAMDE
jgi:acetyl esterase/lipase